jgi:hypothetical protein
MWRTESKLALVAIALIVLGGIYGMSNKVTIEGRCIAVLMENGELIVTIMYCSILNDEQMDQRTLVHCPIYQEDNDGSGIQ